LFISSLCIKFYFINFRFFNTSKPSVSDTYISFSIRGTLFIPIQLYPYDLKISFGEWFVALSRCKSLTTVIPICMHIYLCGLLIIMAGVLSILFYYKKIMLLFIYLIASFILVTCCFICLLDLCSYAQ
jgi:hypothetical protein